MKERILHNLEIPLTQRRRTVTGPYRWTPTPPMSGRGFYLESGTSTLECARHGATFRLRIEHANDALKGLGADHPNAYSTENTFDGIIPIVLRLPRGRGFMAGWTLGPGMCATMEPEIHEDVLEAALYAHDAAERACEREDEYQLAWQRGHELRSQLREAIGTMREAIRRIRAGAQSLHAGAKEAGEILTREGREMVRQALSQRAAAWEEMNGHTPGGALREGFACGC